MRKAAISSGVIGVVLLVAGGLLAWWITPSYIARLPSNYNKTRTYTGTIRSLVSAPFLDLAAGLPGMPASFLLVPESTMVVQLR